MVFQDLNRATFRLQALADCLDFFGLFTLLFKSGQYRSPVWNGHGTELAKEQ